MEEKDVLQRAKEDGIYYEWLNGSVSDQEIEDWFEEHKEK